MNVKYLCLIFLSIAILKEYNIVDFTIRNTKTYMY
jgi:hypothetical protein